MSILTIVGNPNGGGAVTLQSPPTDQPCVIEMPPMGAGMLSGSARVNVGTLPNATASPEIVVPPWATRITVSIDALSTNGNTSVPRIRLAHSAGVGNSRSHYLTYANGASPAGGQGIDIGAVLAGSWAAAVQLSGIATLRRHASQVWHCHWRGTHIQAGTSGAIISESVTRFTTSSGEPDRIQLITGSSDLFDGGDWNVEFHA